MYRKNWELLLLNLMPVIGYWFFGWNMFSIIYLYWVEAVILAFFYVLKKFLARGRELVNPQPGVWTRFWGSLKLLAIRWGIMLFYWVFILVFVAMGQGRMSKDESFENVKILVMMNRGFNLAVLMFFLNGVVVLIRDYILNRAYKKALFSDFRLVFDGRTIILHIVIVLGTFSYQYLYQYVTVDNRLPGLGFVLIFCFLKTIADWFVNLQLKPEEKAVEKPLQ